MTLFMLVPSYFAKTVKKTFSGEILFFLRLPKHVKKEEEKIAWYETELNKQVKHISKKNCIIDLLLLITQETTRPNHRTSRHVTLTWKKSW